MKYHSTITFLLAGSFSAQADAQAALRGHGSGGVATTPLGDMPAKVKDEDVHGGRKFEADIRRLSSHDNMHITNVFLSNTWSCPEGYYLAPKSRDLNGDINQSAGGKDILLCLSNGPGDPITNVKLQQYENCGLGWSIAPKSGAINGDLNQSAGGKDIFLCFTTVEEFGSPITDIILETKQAPSARQPMKPDGLNGDLNQSAGGKDIYLDLLRAQASSCIDTADWQDVDGFGCDWYETYDDQGCPHYGNDYEGTMGLANGNCCRCGVVANAKVKVEGSITFTSDYCRGPQPSREEEERLNTPQPFDGKIVYVKTGAENNFDQKAIAAVKTDANGIFKLALPRGKYIIVDSEREDKTFYNQLLEDYSEKTISYEPIDKQCLFDWSKTPLITFEIVGGSVSPTPLILNIRKGCSYREVPCTTEEGQQRCPMPSNDRKSCARYTGDIPS